MNLPELEDQVSIILSHFRVSFRKSVLARGISSQIVVNDFGLIVCCINRVDYAEASCALNDHYKGWRSMFITTNDNLSERRYQILWNLMRGGYMKWLRYTYPRQLRLVLNGTDNLGQKIIEERLRIWGDQPKYAYFAQDNVEALRNGILRELTNDPSFFDYMPEEE